MRSPCPVCTHEQRRQVDVELARGVAPRDVAGKFGLRFRDVNRHVRERHVSELMKLLQHREDLKTAEQLHLEVEKILAENKAAKARVVLMAEDFDRAGDAKGLGAAIHEIVGINEKLLDVIRLYAELLPAGSKEISIRVVEDEAEAKNLPALPPTGDYTLETETSIITRRGGATEVRLKPALLPAAAAPLTSGAAEPDRPKPQPPEPDPKPGEPASRWGVITDPEAEHRFREAKPVTDAERLDVIHRFEGRRAEVGELSALPGTYDVSAAEARVPRPKGVRVNEVQCPACEAWLPGSAYETHYKEKHKT